MTLQEAYAQLKAKWSGSFCVTVTVWNYDHRPHDAPYGEYHIWDGARRKTYQAPTLEAVMDLALAPRADLAAVEQQLTGLETQQAP